jgi:hypothetical protein
MLFYKKLNYSLVQVIIIVIKFAPIKCNNLIVSKLKNNKNPPGVLKIRNILKLFNLKNKRL